MALTIVVETGEGNPLANSYISAEYAKDYAESIGSDAWTDNCDMHTVALIQSARFLDMRYGNKFKGQVVNPIQGLLYPRTINDYRCGKASSTGIPKALMNAQAALAVQYIEQGGSLDLNANATNMLSSESKSVGNGAVSVTKSYFKPATSSAFSVSDAYVRQLTGNTSNAFVPIVMG